MFAERKAQILLAKPNLSLEKMSYENSNFETSWNLRFSALEPEPSSVFWLMHPSMLHQADQL
jgi:hypothetical protein